VIVEKAGHVVTVTLNRPESKNSMGLELLARLADAWDMIDGDPEVRCAILTGAGGNFSSGADLKTMHSDQSDDPWQKRFKDDPELHWKSFLRSYQLKKPLIAAVEGYAYGGGTEILQATDIRVAGESASFGVTEARWGLFPLGGSTVRLRRQIHHTKAMELLLLARPITAQVALEIGLIGRVVPDGTALQEAEKLAEIVASNGPLAVQAIKRSAWESDGMEEAEALANELKLGWPVFKSRDAREGARAFAEKRKPDFKSE
jgi:enoyl-CoA hydratase